MPDRGSGASRPFVYRADILRELARHGVCPVSRTRPELVRAFVRDLYKFEIRRLKDQMIRKAFARAEYATRVDALRRQYPVLALMPEQFVEDAAWEMADGGGDARVDGND